MLRSESHAQALWAFLRANWEAMSRQGKPLAVTVAEHKAKRSLDQNARLHAMLTDIAEQAWIEGRQFSMETWKEHFRREFIGTEEYDLPSGKRSERGISTTTLDVAAFADFMTRIEEYAVSKLAVEFNDG